MNTQQKIELLSIKNLEKKYTDFKAVDAVNLSVYKGELLAILGPSGCGKSTLLQMIAGLVQPDNGSIFYADNCWVDDNSFVSPEKRDCGMVFQDMALFPHLSAGKNVGFALKRREKREIVTRMLALVSMEGAEKRMVHQLSGGQQQRIALARSLAPEPGLLLLDEPFSSLDFKLRQTMRREMRKILKKQAVTAIMVTHDQNEAFAFADRVAVMFAGRIEQQGSPKEIYQQPATHKSAAFVGDANFINIEKAVDCFPLLAKLPKELSNKGNTLMCRPEDFELNTENATAQIINTEFQGAWQELLLRLDCGEKLRVYSSLHWEKGQRLAIRLCRGCIYSEQGQLLYTFDKNFDQ